MRRSGLVWYYFGKTIMKKAKIIVARVYLKESSKLLDKILYYLKNETKVRGVSVFRAITGYGNNGEIHTTALLDLSLDLPLVIEFFDKPKVVNPILKYLNTILTDDHIVFWEASTNKH